MKIIISFLLIIFWNKNHAQGNSCLLLFCKSFETITSWYKEGDELYLDVTTFRLTKIDFDNKELLYKHENKVYDLDIVIKFNNEGYAYNSKINSLYTGYEAEICVEDFIDSKFHPREQFQMEITNHVSCFLGDCIQYE